MMFSILKNYKTVLLGITALLFVYGLLSLFSRSRKGLKNVVQEYRDVRKRWRLGPLILVVLLLSCFLLPAGRKLDSRATIALNYNLASQGLNPNGTRFNQANILSDEVLERAIKKGALDLTVEDLKDTLQVRPAVEGDSQDEDGYFISTQFVVSYHANKNTSAYSGEKLLTLVTQAYKEWFIQEYSANTSLLKLDFTQAEDQDYLDTCSFLTQTAESIGEYMHNMSSEEAAFRSSVNGETFQSLSSRAYAVSNTMVESLEAHVLEEGVSKDAGRYISRLNVLNVFMDFDAQKAAASNENTLTAISMYENDLARIVLVPTYDTNDQFYMSQTRIGVDDFAAMADDYADEKVRLYGDMADNRHVIEQLSAGSGTGSEKAETLIHQIEQELRRIAYDAEELMKEYNAQQSNKYMTTVVSSIGSQAKSMIVEIAATTFLFAIGLRLCWFSLVTGRKRK